MKSLRIERRIIQDAFANDAFIFDFVLSDDGESDLFVEALTDKGFMLDEHGAAEIVRLLREAWPSLDVSEETDAVE